MRTTVAPATDTRQATRSRAEDYARFRALVDDFAAPPLAGRDDCAAAAATLARALGVDAQAEVQWIASGAPGATSDWFGYRPVRAVAEGRSFRLGIAPGAISVRTTDVARAERRAASDASAARLTADVLAVYEREGVEVPEGLPTRQVDEWSARSRARMFQRIAQLDLSTWADDEGTLAMVTLTLPGQWEHLAPTGKAFKALVRAFGHRWRRAVGPLRGLWKLEFQRRGAPHLHALMRVPVLVDGESFDRWLSRTWAEVVKADDTICHRCGPVAACDCKVPDTERTRHERAGTGIDYSGQRFSDPRRIATYFAGHSSKHTDGKEYQHIVPELWQGPGNGPGRFWGYWGLDAVTDVEVDLSVDDYYRARRILRHVARARAARLAADAARYGRSIPRRRLRSLGHAGGNNGGTVVVNDGVRLAYDLGRALALPRPCP